MATTSNLRILREIADIQKGLDLSLAVAFEDTDVRRVRALIIGPPDTPYEFGFFEFKVTFGKDYPTQAPEVTAITTNGGFTRFNPNIYAMGKVCLSILGTWRGERGEEWSSVQCLESILLSIQSLMSSTPYENEPGFEDAAKGTDAKESKAYSAKIHHETIRISILNRLEEYLDIEGPPRNEGDRGTRLRFGQDDQLTTNARWEPFADLCKRRFLWYYPSYLAGIQAARTTHGAAVADGTKFVQTAFESECNGMNGQYGYTKLEERLKTVRAALEAEEQCWIVEGARALARESPTALSFQNTFRALVQRFKHSDIPLDLELIADNPFAWRIVMFGRPMTNLDGGIFKIRVIFPIAFPQEQPRVTVETPLFHHCISADGILCYFPHKSEDVASHIEGIMKAIDEENPRYDPRAVVNREAARLFWGSAEEKKMYNRRLRRSAQESSEFT